MANTLQVGRSPAVTRCTPRRPDQDRTHTRQTGHREHRVNTGWTLLLGIAGGPALLWLALLAVLRFTRPDQLTISEGLRLLADEPPRQTMATSRPHHASLAQRALRRPHPR
jgi:hypothetical protein